MRRKNRSKTSMSDDVRLESKPLQHIDDSPPKHGHPLWLPLAIVFVLVAATGLAYQGIHKNDFINFDDIKFVSANYHVNKGLSLEGIKWAITDMGIDYWRPLVWMSHMLDVSLFGMWAGGHHLVNLFFHILNSLLLFGFLQYATKKIWPSAFVAALFALHPLHVESVAWIAERKDVLSTFFWFAAMWAYAAYTRRPGWGRYVWVTVLFALGLMCKPILVTFPVILLLLDYWPLERFTIPRWRPKNNSVPPRRLLIEKLPLVAMSVAVTVLTVIGQQKASTVATLEDVSIALRMKNSAVSYWRYIGDMLWPDGLAILYPYSSVPLYQAMMAMAMLAAVTIAVYVLRSRRYLIAGWLWYFIILLPVIGLVQVGPQSHADRYTYVSLTGLFIVIVWLIDEGVQRKAALRIPVAVVAAGVLAMFGFLTWKNTGYWRNTGTLARRAVSVTERNYVMIRLLGESQMAQGDYAAAYASLVESMRVGRREDMPSVLVAMAKLMYEKGDFREAIRCGTDAIEVEPDTSNAWLIIGMALGDMGQPDEAEKYIRKAIELSPDNAVAYGAIGRIMGETERVDEAVAMYKKSLEIDSGLDGVHFNLGVLYKDLGDFAAAADAYGKSIDIKPTFEAWNGLGDCMVAMGRLGEAEIAYRQSLRLNSEEAVTHYNLSLVLLNADRRAEATEEAANALSLAPDNADAKELYRRLTTEQP